MAYLDKYIHQILSRRESVILPGLGRLYVDEKDSLANRDNKIDPPGATIRFDAEHPKDDGKLASEYAQGEGLETEEARQQVLELVDAIKFKMDKGEVYTLKDTGVFSKDDNNKIHFEKDPGWVLDPEAFGLSPLELLELEDENVESSERKEETELKEEPIKVTTESNTISRKSPQTKAVRVPVNKWKIIWVVVGFLAVVLVALLLIPTNNRGDIEFGRDGIVIKDNQSGEQTETQKPDALEETVIPGVMEGSEEEDSNIEELRTESGADNKYFIIAGSFQSLQNATILKDNLEARGYNPEIIITETRLYRVAVKSYSDKATANDELGVLKKEPGLENVWVLTR